MAFEVLDCLLRRGFQQDLAVIDDGHAGAEATDVPNDMGGQDDDDMFTDFTQEVMKADLLLGIQTGGGFVHDDELGVADEGLGDAEALFHAAGVAAEFFVPDSEQVGLM